MPYIAIKAYPKDEKTKKEVCEKINKIFLETWGCKPEAISISFEEFAPGEWEEKVYKDEVEKKADKCLILSGEKKY